MLLINNREGGSISAHNDPEIGRLVTDAIERGREEGVITVAESQTTYPLLCERKTNEPMMPAM